jgi:hypothetical protein
MVTVLATLAVEYYLGVTITFLWMVLIDKPWQVTPPFPFWKNVFGIAINCLLWPVLVIQALRNA